MLPLRRTDPSPRQGAAPGEGLSVPSRPAGMSARRHRQNVPMITSTHAIIYADDADATRAFCRDVLGLANVDAHGGWLIFKLPPARHSGYTRPAEQRRPGHHELYLMCDDILAATVTRTQGEGRRVRCPRSPIRASGCWPPCGSRGGGEIGLYQPKHPTAYDLPD